MILLFVLFLGFYDGFDEDEFTSKTGGKALVIEELKNKYKYNTIVMIGDGITDAEACPPADAFIGEQVYHLPEIVKPVIPNRFLNLPIKPSISSEHQVLVEM